MEEEANEASTSSSNVSIETTRKEDGEENNNIERLKDAADYLF